MAETKRGSYVKGEEYPVNEGETKMYRCTASDCIYWQEQDPNCKRPDITVGRDGGCQFYRRVV